MGFSEAVVSGFRRQFDFRGRSSRSEYWYWNLFFLICGQFLWIPAKILVIVYVIMTSGALDVSGLNPTIFVFMCVHQILQGMFLFFTTIPTLSMTIRRLHDANVSGWCFALPVGLTATLLLSLGSGWWRSVLPIDSSLGVFSFVYFYGWWLVITIKAVNLMSMLAWTLRPGTYGYNRFGDDPLRVTGLYPGLHAPGQSPR